ncbi:hypothetical protein V8C34DRAFT_294495 [Trichoderma compactum]
MCLAAGRTIWPQLRPTIYNTTTHGLLIHSSIFFMQWYIIGNDITVFNFNGHFLPLAIALHIYVALLIALPSSQTNRHAKLHCFVPR